jgi:hypothetical protein
MTCSREHSPVRKLLQQKIDGTSQKPVANEGQGFYECHGSTQCPDHPMKDGSRRVRQWLTHQRCCHIPTVIPVHVLRQAELVGNNRRAENAENDHAEILEGTYPPVHRLSHADMRLIRSAEYSGERRNE